MTRHSSSARTRGAWHAWADALAFLLLASWPAAARAAGAFDAASSLALRSGGSAVAWNHPLGAGPNRVVLVGVTLVDRHDADPEAQVTFNGTPMAPVPGGLAQAGDRRRFLRTQLFYLLESGLPAAGTYRVVVSLSRAVAEIGGGAISLSGLGQSAPEAVAVGATDPPGTSVTTPLTTLTPGAWVVEAVGADMGRALLPASPSQALRYSAHRQGVSLAGAAAGPAAPGTQSLTWTVPRPARLAHVAASLAPPPSFTLTTATDGLGSLARTPDQTSYLEGALVQLDATPQPGWEFAGWDGDASGTDNPLTLAMNASKTVTARFRPDFRLYGWAATNGGTTGGEGGPEVVVDTLAALRFYAAQDTPYVIKIAGTIAGNEAVRVHSNKSILGIGSDARLLGVGLQVGWSGGFGEVHNVVIRNLTIQKALAPIDNIAVAYGATNVWIDHCDLSSDRDHGIDFYDGLLDVSHAADFVTVSWTRFHDHFKTSLVGHSDSNGAEDTGHLTLTYHHDSFNTSGGRNPSVRFGLVHVFNNDYRNLDDYAIASRMEAQVVIENCWFQDVNRPIRADTTLSPVAGFVRGVETNVFQDCTPSSITSPPATWVPPYSYPRDPVDSVPDTIARWAGVGIVTFTGEIPPPTAPTITTPPASQTVDVGADASFTVVADGTFPLAYQWSKDGTVVPGATEATLALTSVQESDGGSYTVTVSNAAGAVTSDPAVLTVKAPPPPPPPPTDHALHELFADGERATQALPDSAAWFTSSGSNNLVATVGELRQIVSSSRTFLAYFTDDQAAPMTLAAGQTLTLGFTFRFTGFDSVALASDATFRVGLLRSVANAAAVNGAGFVASGSPNTNARMSGDFGSNNPASHAFTLYTGYAAFTSANAAGTATPIKFEARTGSSDSLLNSATPYTQFPLGSPVASVPMEANVAYHGELKLVHNGTSISLSYSVVRVSDQLVIMSHTAEDAAAAMAAFDTVAFYVSKASTGPNYDLVLTEVDVERSGP